MQQRPVVEVHGGIHVVRDDLFPGGTKARFIPKLFENTNHLIYASPAQGGAQYALAVVARQLRRKVTIVVAKRQEMHPRTKMALNLGADIVQVAPGYLTVVEKRAKELAIQLGNGTRLLPFGLESSEADTIIAAAALATQLKPDEVWCAAGSGVLARGLMLAWPKAQFQVVQVGRKLEKKDVPGAVIWPFPIPFEKEIRNGSVLPFSSDRNYDAKAWQLCQQHASKRGTVVFWNVLGVAE